MGTLQDMIGALFGRSASAAPTQGPTYTASPRLNYPTSDDVDFARKYDYSYGQPWAPEFNNRSATILAGSQIKDSVPMETMGSSKFEQIMDDNPNVRPLKDVYAKAALASEGNSLAKLGFDPRHFGMHLLSPDKPHTSGTYYPDFDQGWADVKAPDALVHESMHRGIQKLKESPFWKKEFNQFYENPSNERVVRHLMETKMGDPEASRDSWADLGRQQRNDARFMFNQSSMADDRNKVLKQMEDAAAQYIAAKRPGGPR